MQHRRPTLSHHCLSCVLSCLSVTLVHCGQMVGWIKMPPTSSSLRIPYRSFRYASPCLWNQLPIFLRQPHISSSLSRLRSVLKFGALQLIYHISSLCQLTTLAIHNSLFLSLPRSRLKTYLFHKFFPP